jgi:FkbH-like protein
MSALSSICCTARSARVQGRDVIDQRALFKTISALSKESHAAEALRLLREAISRRRLDAEGMDKAGRCCPSLFAASGEKISGRVLVLGQCTTTWLSTALTSVAWGDGRALQIVDGAYDNVLQELLAAAQSERPDVVVLVPWNQRLLFDRTGRVGAERVAAEVAFWRQAWAVVEERLAARIVQVSYDWMTPGARGFALGSKGDGDVALVRAVNSELRESLPAGSMFTDLEQVSGETGRQGFYDARRYYWTKQPFSEQGALRLAEHVWAGVRAVTTGPRKVLVLDLDNTLWGGVVGETGPLGITLGESPDGEAFQAFQAHVKRLSERGIVLAVSSKNNHADAREPFEKNPSMVLSLDDFAHFEANWEPKAMALRRIAQTLQLGLDSFVFADDNPAEREHIRQALPEVAVVDLPADPAEYVQALDAGLWFEAVDLTDEDRVRAEQYRTERRRRDLESTFESLDSYLRSLDMVADLRDIDDADMDRVVQLIGKTNQFNLTTRRHGPATVRQMLGAPGTIGLTLRLVDRFGDYGLVSVLIAVADPSREPGTLRVDTWLMSCRVIGRSVEEFFFNVLVERARRAGVERLVGVYVPSAKNGLVKDLYERMGFLQRATAPEGAVEYEVDLTGAAGLKTFVQSSHNVIQAV